ncbi:unnamed protein product [Polarella glacialis]|uniref:Uncharacterized protein n=1 Tax=Polarella glacialis TaxID=89957 RepID=A0A813DIX3_POLGL|nr:unnamed protein product [Polarella glacialis]
MPFNDMGRNLRAEVHCRQCLLNLEGRELLMQDFKCKSRGKDRACNQRAIRRLRTQCEHATFTPSSFTQATIEIDSLFEGIHYFCSLSLVRSEELCTDYFCNSIVLSRRQSGTAASTRRTLSNRCWLDGIFPRRALLAIFTLAVKTLTIVSWISHAGLQGQEPRQGSGLQPACHQAFAHAVRACHMHAVIVHSGHQ